MSTIKLDLVSRIIDRPNGDVVFIHGLGGDAKKTWSSEDSVGKGDSEREFISYFPAVLSADLPETNIWALDYSAQITNWGNKPICNELPRYCNNIFEYLAGNSIGTRPLILVCHSLGGLVAKEIVRKSSEAKFPRLRLM